ncbi:MAG: NAD(P)-dependent alcohol dehydrogenase [Acidobacteria bacterium]|jgi:NADPH:quinone reductase-like Zn-dependent oxidoreductase|nr:MAG: NAD(P)-dependent alcohol dehydrogenase [Acidobacteriota bacterium]GIU82210.1 MAG: NADPH:quinone oxidoreductase [Pyrinomonadaceae bacterium]
MKAFEIREFGIDNLALVDREIPKPSANEVLVKFHAVSLNYRDLLMVTGRYNPNLKVPIVPCSDGAGEVVEVGKDVKRWKVGDRVMPIFMQGWIDGSIEYKKARTALGGDLDGCLREFGVFHEEGLVGIPENFSYEEAATLPCAALTAYNALFVSGSVKSGETVLTQGTGGVSIFALQFAKAVGAKVFITSSSNEKLQRAKNLGADELINYKETPDWDQAVLELTEKRGVDHIIELGGAGTLQKSLKAVKMGGYIAVIGVLAGKGEFDPILILMKAIRVQGIFVGSREMFEQMNEFIEKHNIKPIIDRTFEFENTIEAFKFMESGSHFGKVVIRLAK